MKAKTYHVFVVLEGTYDQAERTIAGDGSRRSD